MSMLRDSLLYDKVHGVVMGGAVGDAMGGPVECMHHALIRELYGWVNDVMPYDRPEDFFQPGHLAYALSPQAGAYTDDTRLHLLLAGAIVEKGGRINADELSDYWMRKMDVRAFWHSVSSGFHRIALSDTPVREAGRGNISENSAPMCMGAVGVINAGDPAQAAMDAYDLASLSHEGVAREAASALAAAVAEAMKPQTTAQAVIEAALQHTPNRETSSLPERIRRAIALAQQANDTESLIQTYYEALNVRWFKRARQNGLRPRDDERFSPSFSVEESLPVVLGMFARFDGAFRPLMEALVNYGRDCDTMACMGGYIAGAFCGAHAIPEDWRQKLLFANPQPDLPALSEGLCRALFNERSKKLDWADMIESMQNA